MQPHNGEKIPENDDFSFRSFLCATNEFMNSASCSCLGFSRCRFPCRIFAKIQKRCSFLPTPAVKRSQAWNIFKTFVASLPSPYLLRPRCFHNFHLTIIQTVAALWTPTIATFLRNNSRLSLQLLLLPRLCVYLNMLQIRLMCSN